MNPKPLMAGAVLAAALVSVQIRAQAQPFDRRTPVVIAVEKVGPAVVNIFTTRLERRYETDSWFTLRAPRTYKATSLGSGVLIDSVGLVVTNEHVVRNAVEIKIHLSDGRTLAARRIEQAIRSLDLALLQIENSRRESFPYVKLSQSDNIMVGETVIAIGNPFGLENTVTTGVISAKNRSITPGLQNRLSHRDLLQTDASINPGNSGGALVNINGELIGINTAIHARGEGIGFAIPVRAVRTSVLHLLELEMDSRGESLGIGVAKGPEDGVVVNRILENGPAASAGLRRGDFISSLNSRPISSLLEFNLALYAASGRDRMQIRLRRGGKVLEKRIDRPKNRTLTERAREAREGKKGRANRYLRNRIGFSCTGLDPSLARILQLPGTLEGVVVLDLLANGPAAELGIQRFDVILGFGNLDKNFRPEWPLKTAEDLASALYRLGTGRTVKIQIYRRKEEYMHGMISIR